MRKSKDGLCSLQEYNQFKTRIFDAVDEWINFYDSDPEVGVVVDQAKFDILLCKEEEAYPNEWFPMEAFETDGKPDADAILDIADKFCFVK